jgi:hypothetical protein
MLVLKVAKTLMVGSYGESLLLQITSPFINSHHYYQEFFFICRELLIGSAKTFTEISNWMSLLSKYNPNAGVTCIYFYYELLVKIRKSQNRSSGHTIVQMLPWQQNYKKMPYDGED